jgi:hypothetical protein
MRSLNLSSDKRARESEHIKKFNKNFTNCMNSMHGINDKLDFNEASQWIEMLEKSIETLRNKVIEIDRLF